MALRGKNCRDENGAWDIGGGALEFGEDAKERLKKEIKEEYNADVLKTEFLGFRDVHRSHDKKETHWLALDFKVLVDVSQVKNAEPHKLDKVKWFRLDKLPGNLHSELPRFFEIYRSKL